MYVCNAIWFICLLLKQSSLCSSYRLVDSAILNILRQRFEDCVVYETPDHKVKCQPLYDQYNEAAENWFVKCKYYLDIAHMTVCTFHFKLIT
ncbi:hypothetical protein PR048_003254 [Dryococelus australis]|uniref:Secreted protein n=1 Tax=Dryococelus australis TaxID=614101 RepID=A0ABQ9IMJ8_9NEOP|nr:hypothetical protein PR048_003254 [Dryococelus australis]